MHSMVHTVACTFVRVSSLLATFHRLQVLEAREEVESTDDVQRLQQLLARNRQQQEALVRGLSEAFRAGEGQLDRAVALVTQLQYLARLEQEIVKKLPQL